MTTDQLLADRLNAEPVIFRGCTSTELGVVVALAMVAWLPTCLAIAWLLGAPSMGLGLAGVLVVLSVIVTATVLQRLKRGRPEAYYLHRLGITLARCRLTRSAFVLREGHWSLGRTVYRSQ